MDDLLFAVIVVFTGLASGIASGMLGGGGGLITLPVLLSLGLPVDVAIATGRVGGAGNAAGALSKFIPSGSLDKRLLWPVIITASVGSIIGARLLVDINDELLRYIVAVLLVLSLPFVLQKKLLIPRANGSVHARWLGYALLLAVALYGAFFGPPAGLFGMYVYVFFFGKTFIESNALGKIGLVINVIISVAIYAWHGLVIWWIGLLLVPSMFLGSRLGAHLALKHGNAFVQIGIAILVILSSIRLVL